MLSLFGLLFSAIILTSFLQNDVRRYLMLIDCAFDEHLSIPFKQGSAMCNKMHLAFTPYIM